MAEEKLVGKMTHYFGKVSVGMIQLSDVLKVGDTIRVKGSKSDFTQQVSSMQVEHADVSEAKAGETAGIKVDQKVHNNDEVFKVMG